MINDLTNAYAMAKSSGGGLRDQCSSVSTLQQKNMAMATYAKTQCDSKSNTCEVTCKNLYNKLTIAYGNECQMQPNHGLCQEAQTILSQSRGSANGCSNLTSSQGFVSSIAQNAAGLKIAKDCEEKLKNAEGNSFATMPFPPSQESTNVDCSVAANNSHPSCQIETQANQKSSTLPSGEISNGSENPSWFDPKTKTFDDPEDLAQKQFEEKMKAFREGSAKLDSQTQVARGTSSFAGGGLGGSDSSATTSLDPMPSTVAAPEFESQLFKYAGSRKGWSSNGGQWRSPSSTGSKISFSSFLKNEKKPTKIKHPWIGMNIKDLMSTSSKSKDLSLLHPNQWLFGVNSGFQYSLFKNGEPSFLSPHPMNRLKPREDFVGLVQLKAHHKASLLQHCALNSDPVLALNLDNKRLETISKNIVNFSQFNLSNRLNCKNRDLSKGKFQILKQSDLSPFSKGELFESEHFKLTLDNGFRADEKPPLWLFTNKTNEVFFTFTGKMKDVKIDNLITYKLFLDNPIVFKDLSGIDHASQPIKVVIQTIANQKWIDALHYNAEKNGYFTRYLATVYKNKAMVFTFNIHRNAYTKYSDKIAKMIASIRLDGTSPGINYRDEKLRKLYLSQNSKSTPIATNISSLDYDDNRQTSSVKHQSYNPFYMYLGLSILAISSLYYLFSRRRNRSK
jgi:hypothetical protein